MENDKKTYYYKEYTDELIKSKNQNFKLSKNYKWIHSNIFYRMISYIVYYAFKIFGYLYCKIALRVKLNNKKILKKYKNSGYFIYGNHTQVMGDVFIPAIAVSKKRIYVIVNPANLGIPVIGKLLPMLGALPKPESISGMKLFNEAINERIKQKKCVVIYPEAHVWPYYTKIRPYSSKSFKFDVKLDVPAFCMTTTYQKRKYTNKPKITVYIDGPFYPDNNLNKKDRIAKLHDEIYNCMKKRSMENTYEYFVYKKV